MTPFSRYRAWAATPLIAAATSAMLMSTLAASDAGAQALPLAPDYTVFPATGPIAIDGFLDEADWDRAEAIPLSWEILPGDNVPPPVETTCHILFDAATLYFGCRAFDPAPGEIRAHLAERDDRVRTIQDDHIVFLLDPFNDERRAFEFRVNTLGVQMDAILARSEGIEDFSWNAVWTSKVQITEDGYTVEVGIPFGSLRFPQTDDVQTWGLVIDRSYPRSVRTRMRSAPTDRNTTCLLCGANKITGFRGIEPGGSVEAIPTLTAGRQEVRDPFPDGDLEPITETGALGLDPEVGLDVRWGVTTALSLNGTLNPDFSQVEADVAQLAENLRFALLFPETRTFFLEGADFFATPIQAVFTRSVVDPDWGAKLTGKEGANAIGVFSARDAQTDFLFPANQGSRSGQLDQSAENAVVRYRRDIGAASNAGVLYTGRWGAGYQNHVYGVDLFHRLTPSNSVRAQYLRSTTEYPDTIVTEFSQPNGRFDGGSFFTELAHNSANWLATARYTDLTPEFRADAGFIPRVDTRIGNATLGRIFRGAADSWYTRIETTALFSRTQDYEGTLSDQLIGVRATYEGPLQSTFVISPSLRKLLFGGIEHDLNRLEGSAEIRPSGSATFLLGYRVGDFVDFKNNRKSFGLVLTPGAQLYLGRSVSLGLGLTHQRLRWEGMPVYTANLYEGRLIYHFNTRAFVRAIVQYRLTNRDPTLYMNPIDARSEKLLSQFLFSYEVTPQTVVFLGYSDGSIGSEDVDLLRQQRSIFLKFGYAIRP
jgi:Domain of unknown function (DUF5916)